jgi:hypothetical protein
MQPGLLLRGADLLPGGMVVDVKKGKLDLSVRLFG